jgi:hypothetical protein
MLVEAEGPQVQCQPGHTLSQGEKRFFFNDYYKNLEIKMHMAFSIIKLT